MLGRDIKKVTIVGSSVVFHILTEIGSSWDLASYLYSFMLLQEQQQNQQT